MDKRFLFLILIAAMLLVGTVNADTTDTFYPTVDGYTDRSSANSTYSAIRNNDGTSVAIGDAVASSTYLFTATTTGTNLFALCRVTIFSFNVSSLPDNAIISSASFYATVASEAHTLGSPSYGITGGVLGSNTTIVKEDHDGGLDVAYSDTYISQATIVGANKTWPLNAAGISAIDKTGFIVIYLRDSWDWPDDAFGGTWAANKATRIGPYFVDDGTTGRRPRLEITYTLPDTEPPASITNLTYDNATCEQITFDWDNPTDEDFNGTEYWWNDVKGTNFTAESGSWILFGGLTGGTEYTFSTRTFDTTGNANATFVNMSAIPSVCGAAPVANFTADNTSVCIGDPIWFNDTSEYTPVGANDDYFEWDFGDGNTTAGYRVDGYNAPTYNYSFAGNKTVILTVTNKYGSDNETKVDYIEVIDCSITAYFTSNVTCQIGVPVDVLFESSCDQSVYKNSWQPGDGMLIEDVQNLTYTYDVAGAYTVTHVCTPPPPGDAASYIMNITIGPEGTVCEDDCGGPGDCTITNSYGEEPNYLIVGATVGILFGMVMFRRNGKE